eukprot:5644679-Prymnesium_polylepis.1
MDFEELADDVNLAGRSPWPSHGHADLRSVEPRPEAARARGIAARESHGQACRPLALFTYTLQYTWPMADDVADGR